MTLSLTDRVAAPSVGQISKLFSVQCIREISYSILYCIVFMPDCIRHSEQFIQQISYGILYSFYARFYTTFWTVYTTDFKLLSVQFIQFVLIVTADWCAKCWSCKLTFILDEAEKHGLNFCFLAVQNSSIGDLVPCLVCPLPLTIRVFTTLQSEPGDLWPLRNLIRVMKRHDLTEKIPTYLLTYPPTYLPTYPPPLQNTLKEQS